MPRNYIHPWFGLKQIILICAVMPLSVFAKEYYGAKEAMIEAIDAKDGKASGVLKGEIADRFAETTRSSSPVIIEVSTIKSFKQEGCKRLNMRLKQANVPTKDGKTAEFAIDYGINLCRDGSPPTEGMDLEKVGKALGSGGVAEGYR